MSQQIERAIHISTAGGMGYDQKTLLADATFVEIHTPERLRTTEIADELGKSVFGQKEACIVAAEMINGAQSGFHDGNRPLGSAVFLGPTGTGKTELGKSIARLLFPNDPEGHTVIVDGTTLQEASSVTRLKGSDPKYVGFGGEVLIMPDKVKNGAVIIVDEIEKAHPEVWKWFMPLLDVGKTTLFLTTDKPSKTGVQGAFEVEPQDLNVNKCFILFTSNEGAAQMQDARAKGGTYSLGFRSSQGQENGNIDFQDIALDALKKGKFRTYPEFLGRIDRVVVFRDLQEEHYGQVFYKFFSEAMENQMKNDPKGNIPLMVTTELKDWIIKQANVKEFGAREIRSTLHKLFLQKVADYKAAKAFVPGSLAVGYITSDGELRFKQQLSPIGVKITDVFGGKENKIKSIIPLSLPATIAAEE